MKKILGVGLLELEVAAHPIDKWVGVRIGTQGCLYSLFNPHPVWGMSIKNPFSVFHKSSVAFIFLYFDNAKKNASEEQARRDH